MYQVYLDGVPIHDPLLEVSLGEPVLTLTDNKTGAFDFQIYPGNPGYNRLNKLRSVIQVFRGEEELFRGRMIEEEKDFDGVKRIACEGEMSFLLDSIQRPKIYQQHSLSEFLKAILDLHNSQAGAAKKIELGNVTVRDPAGNTERTTNWEPTLTCLNGLLDSLGGHFRIRYVNEIRYLDYLYSYDRLTAQVIEFGENLLDYSETTTAGDIATCIIPLGEKLDQKDDTDKKLDRCTTIESVNGGKDYLLNEEAAQQFGIIARTVKFDKIASPADLKTAGANYLNQLQFENLTLSVKAIDLNLMHVDIAPIRMGDNIRVCSKPHGMDRVFPVLQRTYHLADPTEDTITLGDTMPKTFNDTVSSVSQDTTQAIREQHNATEYYTDTAKLFSAMAAASLGSYETSKNENGSSTHYWHDQPRLEDSSYIRKSNANGFFFTTTGLSANDWKGIDTNTNTLFEALTAKRITADVIRDGMLRSNNSGSACFDLKNGILSATQLVSDDYPACKLSISPSEMGDFGAINAEDENGSFFSVYKMGNYLASGTIITSPWKTNSQGSNHKGIAIFDDSILLFAENDGVPMGLQTSCEGTTTVYGDFNVSGGSKNRVVPTSAGDVCIAAYETAEPMFGDIGESQTNKNGTAKIPIDPLFAETVNTKQCAYQVFLQPYANGNFWVCERAPDYFIVNGPAGAEFAWEIKARQKGYESVRLKKLTASVKK